METLTKRQVGQTPALLWETAMRCATDGQDLYILHKGKPAFRVEYIGDAVTDPLGELERQGLVERAAVNPSPIPDFAPVAYSRRQVEDLVAWAKQER